jgi:putative FmdB family regulatory protein
MPIYAYKCDSCGHAKDVLQKISDPILTDCPACGKPAFKKQVTAAGFQLKGSGWYVTDFRDGKKTGADKKPAESADGAPKEAAKDAAKEGGSDAGKSSTESTPAAAAPAPAPAAPASAAKPAAAPPAGGSGN